MNTTLYFYKVSLKQDSASEGGALRLHPESSHTVVPGQPQWNEFIDGVYNPWPSDDAVILYEWDGDYFRFRSEHRALNQVIGLVNKFYVASESEFLRYHHTLFSSQKPTREPFAFAWCDHSTDEALRALCASLRAPYGFLDHCFDLLSTRLSRIVNNSLVIPRGSFSQRVGLQNLIDLDLDLILPRAYLALEDIKKVNCREDEIQLSDLCERIYKELEDKGSSGGEIANLKYRTTLVRRGDKPFSRSIKVNLTHEQIPIEVDIFPKFISQKGFVESLSRKNSRGERKWTTPVRARRKRFREYSDTEEAVVLLLKSWRADMKENRPTRRCLKSFHFNLAIEKLSAAGRWKAGKPGPLKRKRVAKGMLEVVDYLRRAFNSASDDPEFRFKNIPGNPFLEDVEPDLPQDFAKRIGELEAILK